MLQDSIKYKAVTVFTSRMFLSRTVPALAISLMLAFLLRYDLLIVSGLLFCCWIYLNTQPKRILVGGEAINRLFLLVTGVALLSRTLFLIKFALSHHQSLHESVLNVMELYKLCYLSVSYQSFGFVRRGLIPTLVRFLSHDYLVQIYLVQLIGFACLMTGLYVLYERQVFSSLQKSFFVPALLLSPIGVYSHFCFSLGYYDMALIGLLFLSFAFRGHPASVLFDATGLLVHEAYIFLRLPFLLFDLWLQITGRGREKAWNVWVSIFVNGAVFLLILLWPRPGEEALKNNYFHQYAVLKIYTPPGAFDAFHPLSREGTLAADITIMKEYYASRKFLSYLFPLALSMISINGFTWLGSRLKGRQRGLDLCFSLLVSFFPLLLGLFGSDFGRWIAFSYITWMSYYILFRPRIFPEARISENCLYAVFLAALFIIPLSSNLHPLFTRLFG